MPPNKAPRRGADDADAAAKSAGAAEDLRRLVEEAAASARAAQEAAERMRAEGPSLLERVVDAVRGLLSTFVELILSRVRLEIENVRRSGEELVARTLRAFSRSLRHVLDAALLAFAAAVLLAVALVTLTAAMAIALNQVLGAPAGAAVTGFVLLGLALLAWSLARRRLRAIGEEGDALSQRWRG